MGPDGMRAACGPEQMCEKPYDESRRDPHARGMIACESMRPCGPSHPGGPRAMVCPPECGPGAPRPGGPCPPACRGFDGDDFFDQQSRHDPRAEQAAQVQLRSAIRDSMRDFKASVNDVRAEYQAGLKELRAEYERARADAQATYKACVAEANGSGSVAEKTSARAECRAAATDALADIRDSAADGKFALRDELEARMEETLEIACDDLRLTAEDVLAGLGFEDRGLRGFLSPDMLGPCAHVLDDEFGFDLDFGGPLPPLPMGSPAHPMPMHGDYLPPGSYQQPPLYGDMYGSSPPDPYSYP